MERRTYATIKVHWPNKKVIVTSPQINFEDYPTKDISKDDVINIMVGDLQRIKIYPDKGFQIFHQEIILLFQIKGQKVLAFHKQNIL